MSLFKTFQFIGLLFFLFVNPIALQAKSPEALAHRFLQEGGALRMTTMRILQEYAMVGMNNHFKDPDKSLAADMQSLDKSLQEMIDSFKSRKDRQDYGYAFLLDAQTKLKKAKKILRTKVSKENALAFWKAVDGVRDALNKSLAHLSQEVYPDDEIAQGIMYANRLSTIAQRFGALYLYKVWGFDKELHADKQLAFLSTFFPDAVDNVADSAEELPKATQKRIDESLQGVKRNIMFFVIMGKSSHRFIPTLIYDKAEKIAESANRIAELFLKAEAS